MWGQEVDWGERKPLPGLVAELAVELHPKLDETLRVYKCHAAAGLAAREFTASFVNPPVATYIPTSSSFTTAMKDASRLGRPAALGASPGL